MGFVAAVPAEATGINNVTITQAWHANSNTLVFLFFSKNNILWRWLCANFEEISTVEVEETLRRRVLNNSRVLNAERDAAERTETLGVSRASGPPIRAQR